MAHYGSHAHNAALGCGASMMVLAAAGVGLANAISNDLDAAREARYDAAYGDALTRATAHACAVERAARTSVQRVAELEAQVRSLKAACAQRQSCIESLVRKRAA